MIWIYILLAVIGLVFGFVKKNERELEERIQRIFEGKNILFMDQYALFIAQKSDGYSHVRGVGYLVLTDQELYYQRQFGKKVLSIPLSSIVQGETLKLGGQCIGRPLLKVAFKTQGGEDAVAWRVKELHRWIDEITASAKESIR